MEEIMYTKSTDGIAYQIAHVYEHAFIMLCTEQLSKHGPAPLLADFSAETFYATFMYVRFDSFSTETSARIRKLFMRNQVPSSEYFAQAITQTECEDCATATIINRTQYEQQLNELCTRPWAPIVTQPLVSEGVETKSSLIYTDDKSQFKHATITINFGLVDTANTAFLNRLALLVTSSISQRMMFDVSGYTHGSDLLEVTEGIARLKHAMTVPAITSKTEITQSVTDALAIFTNEQNRPHIQTHLDNWSKNWTQQACISYYRETGVLAGSKTTAKLFKSYDYVSVFKKCTVKISLRKIR